MGLADCISFSATSAGTGDFVVGTARNGFITPAQAVTSGALADGAMVSYLAQDSLGSPTQCEWGHGTFHSAGNGSITRTTVFGTVNNGTPGSGSPLNFPVAPIVSLTVLSEDLLQQTSAPSSSTSAGAPLQFAFDGSGNLYICYATNTWAKFTNVAPFSTFSQELFDLSDLRNLLKL